MAFIARPFRRFLILGTLLFCGFILAGLSGCSRKYAPPPPGTSAPKGTFKPYTIDGKTYYPLQKAEGFRQEGLASWYGAKFHGRRTSNGEIYNMDGMSAAHKTLPMNTWVKVTNKVNGKSITVRINDRGPFVRGRIIDLSREAAKRLEVYAKGTAPVYLEALGWRKPDGKGYIQPPSYKVGDFTVQVGAFTVKANADRLAARLRAAWGQAVVVRHDRGDQVFHRVRVGREHSLDKAMALQGRLRAAGYKGAFTVAW